MRRSFFATRRANDDGFVAVWMVVVLVLLLSVAAFAVDLVHAYVEAEEAQNAADAAALAGSTLVPTNPDCVKPTNRVEQLAKDNGFDVVADPNVKVNATCSGPNEITVEVKRTFPTFFARIMGFDSLTVGRTGIAQYDAPLQMGSPTNWLGSVPRCPDDTAPSTTTCLNASETFADGFLWGSIQGPDGDKAQGNALTNNNCVEQASDNCDSAKTPNNTDHAISGSEYYLVNNPANEAGTTLNIYSYDAGFVPTGIKCDPLENDIGLYSTVPFVNAHWATNEPQYCTGDTSFGTPQGVDTTFTVYAPDSDSDPSNNTTQVCAPKFIPGKGPNGNPNKSASDAYNDTTTRPYFRQWQPLCSVGTAVGGEYVVRVTATGVGKGTNQFGLMGLHNASTPDHISVYARDQLALAAVDPNGGGSKFYLTRVFPSERARDVVLSFFDLGDNSFIVPPATSPVRVGEITVGTSSDVSSSFRGALGTTGSGVCSYRPPPITNGGPRTLPLTSTPQSPNGVSGCSFAYDSNNTAGQVTWDSRWVEIQVHLPGKHDTNGYDCNNADPLGCWLILDMKPSGGGALTDATTWSASIKGGPVRLVG